ncbi:tetratricopeptide repeat protein [Synechococcus sp. 8F6]|uniref:tetratricopeptide repeat protein n=1 Tax=Synechococcus sp. 8F6 TaxID=2025606 RepID=UPI0013034459|nr:tetratricopeptide repeat protein [Synechococcus sp. 8F6]
MGDYSMHKLKSKTRILFASMVAIAAVINPISAASKQDPLANSSEYMEAFARIDAKDYKGAIIILEQLRKKTDNSPSLYYALGKAQQELGENKNALANYDKAISLDKTSSKAFSNRGLIQGALGNLKAALADFTKAIEINPRYDHAYSNRGVTRGALGDLKGAIADFTKAISINPRFSAAWRNRGITREIAGNLKGACEDWRKAATLGQTDAAGWANGQCK